MNRARRLRDLLLFSAFAMVGAGMASDGVMADSVIAARTLPARSVLGPSDLRLSEMDSPGAITDMAEAVGLETRISIYQGRPVRPGDLRQPAVMERNDLVAMSYRTGALDISAEGRAMDRAGIGERVRVMNLSSRKIVVGRVIGPTMVQVSP